MRWTIDHLKAHTTNNPDIYAEAIRQLGVKSNNGGRDQELGESGVAKKPRRAKEPNKTERRFERDYLEGPRLQGLITYQWEGEKLRLAERTTLTPDYLILAGERKAFVEVKGAFIRDDGWMKLKIAADKYPEWPMWLAQYIARRGWSVVSVHPNEQSWQEFLSP
jgi:hypothetical protein